MRDREASGLLSGTALADFSAWLDFLVIMMLAGYRYPPSGLRANRSTASLGWPMLTLFHRPR